MFIPRSLAKRVTKPAATQPGPSLLSVQVADSKKRNSPDEQTPSASSDRSDSGSDNSSESDSESGSKSDSDGGPHLATTVDRPANTSKSYNKKRLDPSEIAARLEVALSDIWLWRNESLYQRIAGTSDWFIPFSRLRDHPLLAPIFDAEYNIPDASLVNALRTYGFGNFEFQMKLREPSNAAWKDKGEAQFGWVGAAGGYEIRAKSWALREDGWMDELGSADERSWMTRMVYVERVPSSVRSTWALYRFVSTLVSSSEQEHQFVQDVLISTAEPSLTTPAQSGRFRGQAFVVFATYELAHDFCKQWGWNTSRGAAATKCPELKTGERWGREVAEEAARVCGFRSLSKSQWDKLKAEYLEHQARVLKQAPRRPKTDRIPTTSTLDPPVLAPVSQPSQAPTPRHTTRPPAFPPSILVFVKHLHPETNKTTLKTLFGRGAPNGVEYIDFQKGIDSAHIRLRTPDDATRLANYFSEHKIVQEDGLDDTGQETETNPIEAEVVLGTRETNYWAKVPEKVRMEAVVKAGLGGRGEDGDGGGKGRRKRQRKA
ncbi:RNA-binding motif protein [Rhizoctonia solani 123E]|uniref:RNA-binding motif protein n=1 Tax=Rhizoctonia solani 123E TaxID=1423351 RepID=A0A074RP70_9AGAM|nr:RNA-binding motif protein [Rhizoctonia solani 123E]